MLQLDEGISLKAFKGKVIFHCREDIYSVVAVLGERYYEQTGDLVLYDFIEKTETIDIDYLTNVPPLFFVRKDMLE